MTIFLKFLILSYNLFFVQNIIQEILQTEQLTLYDYNNIELKLKFTPK